MVDTKLTQIIPPAITLALFSDEAGQLTNRLSIHLSNGHKRSYWNLISNFNQLSVELGFAANVSRL